MPFVQPHKLGASHWPFFEFGQAAVFSLGQPAIQIPFSTRGQHHDKLLAQLVSSLQGRRVRLESVQRAVFAWHPAFLPG